MKKRTYRQWSRLCLVLLISLLILTGCGRSGEPITCTISISCETILAQMEQLKEGKEAYVPEDGWILETQTMELSDGSSVFDLLQKACQENEIQMEYSTSPVYRSAYIEGIHQIYELDCGSTSGWMYRVNGIYPNYGAGKYELKDGDQVEFLYTCDLGKDIGKEQK